ncbi:unnamed protein product, partial [Mesorhabditis belari]|uniref:Uncharacterized protein n=1 Tax=Mesorhabditis belari TaxID=2138241 RepID=A0AAF3FB06_9BILA
MSIRDKNDEFREKSEPQVTTPLTQSNNKAQTNEKRTNGTSVLTRRDTPQTLPLNETRTDPSTNGTTTGILASKPIGEIESASQADFFRMLDEKIAHGRVLDETPSDNE